MRSSLIKNSMDHRRHLSSGWRDMWSHGCETSCDSNLKGQAGFTQFFLVEYFPSPWWSDATPWTQTASTSGFLARESLLGAEKEAWAFNHRLLHPGLRCTLSLRSTPGPNQHFPEKRTSLLSALETRSSPYKKKTISFAVLAAGLHP